MPQPTPRFWLTTLRDCDGYLDSGACIRLEIGGRSYVGQWTRGNESLHWQYDYPGDELDELALACLLDANEHGVPGAQYMGQETDAEMHRQILARCESCSAVQASIGMLSTSGRCGRCFVAAMAGAL